MSRTSRQRAPSPALRVPLLVAALVAPLAAACAGAPVGPVARDGVGIVGLDGSRVPFSTLRGDAWTVIVFVARDCPIANRYAPELEAIRAAAGAAPVRFALVYPGPQADPDGVRAHRDEYGLAWPAYLDPRLALADRLGADVTPEAVVIAPDGEIVYRGRIDDRYVEFGRWRAAPRSRDLRDVVTEVAAGRRPRARVTRAVGCFLRGTSP